MRKTPIKENLFLHGIHKDVFDLEFRIDESFFPRYDRVWRQALRCRRHTIWKANQRKGLEVGVDSSGIILTDEEKAEAMLTRIRHMFTTYDPLWKKYWGSTCNAGLIHGDYRIAAVTKIVEVVPQLITGYDLVVKQSIDEQVKTYAELSAKIWAV